MAKNIFRNELAKLKPYVPGKPIEEVKKEYGIDNVVKLASNENPTGPSPKALEAIRNELGSINIYPDPSASKLREALAVKYGIDSDNIIVGNGGEQILDIIARTFINAGDEAIMADITFDLYDSTVSFLGGVAVKVPLKSFKYDIEGFLSKINEKTKLIYVCNPNNPTGNILTRSEVEYLLDNVPPDVVIVLDEAYYDYARVNPEYPETIGLIKTRPNTIILRTFSKVAGIAAVRVGFAITSAEIVGQMSRIKATFSVNRLAQAAALGALQDKNHIEKTVKLNYQSIKLMEDYFEKKKLEYVKSNSNFVFVNVNKDSKHVFQKLMEKGIIIRPGYIWNKDTWLRVSTGTVEQTKLFLAALDDLES